MPSVAVKIYSVFFKLLLRHKLLSSEQEPASTKDGYGLVASRPSGGGVPSTASFVDGVASKDVNIDAFNSLSLRIFLPQSALPRDQQVQPSKTGLFGFLGSGESDEPAPSQEGGGGERQRRNSHIETLIKARRPSYGLVGGGGAAGGEGQRSLGHLGSFQEDARGNGFTVTENNDSAASIATTETEKKQHHEGGNYRGYLPPVSGSQKKLPIILQFHGGFFVTGSKDAASNDLFCRRMAKLCDAIVIAVGYRLAPEHRYPAAFADAFEALRWLATQANLAECNKSLGHVPTGFFRSGSDIYRPDLHRELVDSFGWTAVEPWLAAHGDPSRCVLLGVSSGSNIADYVTRKVILEGKKLEPVKIVAQVLMYPCFMGTVPTPSEINLSNSYFYDKSSCVLAWKLFLPDGELDPDHPAANPLPKTQPPLRLMPPTLTVVAELDWMKDRAIAYAGTLRRVNIDAPVLEYKDAVHEFATLDFLIKSRQAEACAEDMAIWIKKYISLKGHEFSY